jgi:ketosteroid isomerase-like protein
MIEQSYSAWEHFMAIIKSAPRLSMARGILLSCCAVGAVTATLGLAPAQDAKPPAEDPAHEQLRALRRELVEAVNKSDIDALLKHLDNNVVITWMDGTVSRGPQGVRSYIEEIMKGPNRKIVSYKTEPEIDELTHLYGDTGIASGKSRDEVVQADGQRFAINTRFTTTLVKKDGAWKVASFHGSTNLFDNPVLHTAVHNALTMAGAIGVGVGLVIGILAARMLRSRKQPA